MAPLGRAAESRARLRSRRRGGMPRAGASEDSPVTSTGSVGRLERRMRIWQPLGLGGYGSDAVQRADRSGPGAWEMLSLGDDDHVAVIPDRPDPVVIASQNP